MYKRLLLFILNLFAISEANQISKIIVIADVHGDLARFRTILQDARILNSQDKWIAEPNTVVVQLGDQIDPKYPVNDSHHFRLTYFTHHLQKMAKANYGDFISIIGNHELMNIEKIKNKPELCSIIASRPIILKLDNYLFCHGMFTKRHYYLLDIYNQSIENVNNIWKKYVNDIPITLLNEEIILNNLILDTENSILYTRVADSKIDINKLFNLLSIEYMFVGHTISEHIHLKDKVWYMDLLLQNAFNSKSYNYVIIKDGDIIIKHVAT